ncbi:MAG: hypothetical protein AB8G95_17940 [Anaerolineae bacterium]
MLKMKRFVPFALIALYILTVGCSSNTNGGVFNDGGFEDGHEWIMPNPPAEFNLSVQDSNSQPIADATFYIYLDDAKLEQIQDFIDYDAEIGYLTDESGVAKIIYLGDQGGGYEVPLGSSGPAELFLVAEAAGYEPQRLSVIDYLFRSDHQTGREEREIAGQTLELRVVEDTIILQKN